MKCTKCPWWEEYNDKEKAKICKNCKLANTDQCNDCPYLGKCRLMEDERLIKDEKTRKLWESCTQ